MEVNFDRSRIENKVSAHIQGHRALPRERYGVSLERTSKAGLTFSKTIAIFKIGRDAADPPNTHLPA